MFGEGPAELQPVGCPDELHLQPGCGQFASRDNLAGLATEQEKALGDLVLAARDRQAAAEKAVSEAKAIADLDYAAANRLQPERTGRNQCAAATSIIDTELGL